MTIQKINEDTLEQCCNNCGAVRDLKLDELTLGVVVEEHTIPNVICLPVCDQCPTTEYLFVSEAVISETASDESGNSDQLSESDPEEESTESSDAFKSSHQLLVDDVGKRLYQIISVPTIEHQDVEL